VAFAPTRALLAYFLKVSLIQMTAGKILTFR